LNCYLVAPGSDRVNKETSKINEKKITTLCVTPAENFLEFFIKMIILILIISSTSIVNYIVSQACCFDFHLGFLQKRPLVLCYQGLRCGKEASYSELQIPQEPCRLTMKSSTYILAFPVGLFVLYFWTVG